MDDPVTMYLNDVFTVPADLAGIPALSVPAGLDGAGLPLGLQVMGRPFDEETVFAVGAAIEQAAGFTARPRISAGSMSIDGSRSGDQDDRRTEDDPAEPREEGQDGAPSTRPPRRNWPSATAAG